MKQKLKTDIAEKKLIISYSHIIIIKNLKK